MSEVEEIKKALNDCGYSPKAIREIVKWYELLGENPLQNNREGPPLPSRP